MVSSSCRLTEVGASSLFLGDAYEVAGERLQAMNFLPDYFIVVAAELRIVNLLGKEIKKGSNTDQVVFDLMQDAYC